ncbi:hypothetical protein BOTBODRAFT_25712 [Botryobasidium botryosum FD-172 SS1]|uniref:Uncharacterized protein n=1 Tax=Botryobasidium botryosum (strain FD-172 SS1) TaxID=930990 RepID=A0A067NB00_BOTB1|nr:hypothetical protein BOTBODRAFT_25712 [Botryobasidium botryosum FD-172 SS1]
MCLGGAAFESAAVSAIGSAPTEAFAGVFAGDPEPLSPPVEPTLGLVAGDGSEDNIAGTLEIVTSSDGPMSRGLEFEVGSNAPGGLGSGRGDWDSRSRRPLA